MGRSDRVTDADVDRQTNKSHARGDTDALTFSGLRSFLRRHCLRSCDRRVLLGLGLGLPRLRRLAVGLRLLGAWVSNRRAGGVVRRV